MPNSQEIFQTLEVLECPGEYSEKAGTSFSFGGSKEFSQNKKGGDYADLLCVSASHLNEIVRGNTGYSDKHMKEIAYQLGFESISHFSKYFRNKLYGC